MEENVYQYLDKFDYLISSKSELHLAKQYLAACGFKPDVLDHWAKPAICKVGPAIIESSELQARPASFPTLPAVDSHQSEKTTKKINQLGYVFLAPFTAFRVYS